MSTRSEQYPELAEQYLEAFETAEGIFNSASETANEAEGQMMQIVKDAKRALPNDQFQNFRDRLYVSEYLSEGIEDALGEVEEQTDRDDDESAD
jgi:hypothetical protein